MFIIFDTIWFVVEVRYILFWLYLWQLKEYHLGRFTDHFATYKGKKIFFNLFYAIKIVLFALLLAYPPVFSSAFLALSLVYFLECLLLLRGLPSRSIKKPVLTAKMQVLLLASLVVLSGYLALVSKLPDTVQPTYLLAFDLAVCLVVSLLVLLLQPFAVLSRMIVLSKATKKLQAVRSRKKITVIAITGSYGKTSTKEFLATILKSRYKVLATKAHQNSEIGIARTILNELDDSYDVVIAEVGAYNKGKVREVCTMLKPSIGVVTGVNEQHLSLFGSMENLLSAEGGGELVQLLPSDGLMVLNGDNTHCLDLYQRIDVSKKLYSTQRNVVAAEIIAEEVTANKDSLSLVVRDKENHMAHFHVRVLGAQHAENMLAAITVAGSMDMTLSEIAEASVHIAPDQGGMTLHQGKYGIEVIDASYSSNPTGVRADLKYLSLFPQKKVVVMPCLIELGKDAKHIHYQLGRKIAKVCDFAIITSRDFFTELKRGALEEGMLAKHIVLCDNAQDIHSLITLFCSKGDAVLLEGRVPGGLLHLLKDELF